MRIIMLGRAKKGNRKRCFVSFLAENMTKKEQEESRNGGESEREKVEKWWKK